MVSLEYAYLHCMSAAPPLLALLCMRWPGCKHRSQLSINDHRVTIGARNADSIRGFDAVS